VFAGLALRSALVSRPRTSIMIRHPLPTRVPCPPTWPRADGRGQRWHDRDSSPLHGFRNGCLCSTTLAKQPHGTAYFGTAHVCWP
jgi:hypothetical protein